MVCSFFLCHRHLCTVSFFHCLFCHRHSCLTFCLCLVSACFRVSVYLSIFGIMLCACCLSASSLEIQTWILSKSVTLSTALQILLWSKPHLVFCHKVYKIALSEVLAKQMGVTEAQHQSQLVWIVQIWPIFASQRVDSVGSRAWLCFGLLVSCYSLLQYSRPAWLSFLLTTRIYIQWTN